MGHSSTLPVVLIAVSVVISQHSGNSALAHNYCYLSTTYNFMAQLVDVVMLISLYCIYLVLLGCSAVNCYVSCSLLATGEKSGSLSVLVCIT